MIIIHQNIYFGYLGPGPPIINSGPASLKGAAQTVSLLNKTTNPLSPNWELGVESVTRKYLGFISLSELYTSLYSCPLVRDREIPRHIKMHIFYGLN